MPAATDEHLVIYQSQVYRVTIVWAYSLYLDGVGQVWLSDKDLVRRPTAAQLQAAGGKRKKR